MEVTINKKISLADLKNAYKTLTRLYYKKALIVPIIMLGFGIVFTFLGLKDGRDMHSSSSRYNAIIKEDLVTNTYYNYHITFGLGVGLLLISLYWILITYRNNRYILKKIFSNSIPTHNLTVTINNDGIQYSDYQSKLDENWSAFSRYTILDNILFIFKYGDFYNPLKIFLTNLTEVEITELKKLLTENLKN